MGKKDREKCSVIAKFSSNKQLKSVFLDCGFFGEREGIADSVHSCGS